MAAGDPAWIGRYRVVGRLGAGGQGVVYLALSPTGRPCAVKVLQAAWAAGDDARRRLAREAAAAVRVGAFCTARVLEVGVDAPQPFIATEYVEGVSLADHVARLGPLRGHQLHGVAVATATALVAVHHAGIVHRDLKPSNVMLTATGAKVIDFGIAVDLSAEVTASGELVGTPSYLPPERLQGLAAGPPGDVFSWAETMAFAATGSPPFGTGPVAAVLYRVVHAEPDLFAVPDPLAELLARALHKDPSQRPLAGQLLAELLGARTERTAGTPWDATVLLPRGAEVASAAGFPRPPAPVAAPPAPVGPAPGAIGGPPPPGMAVLGDGRDYQPPPLAWRARQRWRTATARAALGVASALTVVGVPVGVWGVVSAHAWLVPVVAVGPLLAVPAGARLWRQQAAPDSTAGIDLPARATLNRVSERPGSYQGRRMLRFEGWVRIGGVAHPVAVEGAPPLHVLEQLRRLETIPVLVDPRDPARMILDWDAVVREGGVPGAPDRG